ncbi:MAG: hypothetical protein WC795_01865 [Candidatus Paceibacterota bacterium]|jgi:hypothetical protein
MKTFLTILIIFFRFFQVAHAQESSVVIDGTVLGKAEIHEFEPDVFLVLHLYQEDDIFVKADLGWQRISSPDFIGGRISMFSEDSLHVIVQVNYPCEWNPIYDGGPCTGWYKMTYFWNKEFRVWEKGKIEN